MAGQPCDRCGGSRTDGRCACPAGADEETALLPVVPATDLPELVRPYINPTELTSDADQDLDADQHGSYAGSVVPGIDAPRLVRSSRARVLAGQLVSMPGQRRGEFDPYDAANVRRSATVAGTGRPERGRPGQARRAALIIAGALAVAGLGTAAAMAPRLLDSSDHDQAKPQPGVTLAMPTVPPESASTRAHAVQPTRAARTTTAPAATVSPHPSSSPTASAAGPTATAGATHRNTPATASPSGSATTAAASAALRLGDRGAAVTTLQTQLAALWIDHSLPADGAFDVRTQTDVTTFQVWYSVHGDPQGVFGPNCQAKMATLFPH